MKNLKFFLLFFIFTNFMSFLIGASIKNIMVTQDPEVGYYKINFDLTGMKNKFYLIKIIPYKDKREIEQPKFMFGECVNTKCEADKNFCVFWDPVLEGVEPDNWSFKIYIDRTIYRISGELTWNVLGFYSPLDNNIKEVYGNSITFGLGGKLWDYSGLGIELDVKYLRSLFDHTYKDPTSEEEGSVTLDILPDINLGLLYKLNIPLHPYFGAGGCFYSISEHIDYDDTEKKVNKLSSGRSDGYYLKFGIGFPFLSLETTYSKVVKEYKGYYGNFKNFSGLSVCLVVPAEYLLILMAFFI